MCVWCYSSISYKLCITELCFLIVTFMKFNLLSSGILDLAGYFRIAACSGVYVSNIKLCEYMKTVLFIRLYK